MAEQSIKKLAHRISKLTRQVEGIVKTQQVSRTVIGGESLESQVKMSAEDRERLAGIVAEVGRVGDAHDAAIDGMIDSPDGMGDAAGLDALMRGDEAALIQAGYGQDAEDLRAGFYDSGEQIVELKANLTKLEEDLSTANGILDEARVELETQLSEAREKITLAEAQLAETKRRADEAFGAAEAAGDIASVAKTTADAAGTAAQAAAESAQKAQDDAIALSAAAEAAAKEFATAEADAAEAAAKAEASDDATAKADAAEAAAKLAAAADAKAKADAAREAGLAAAASAQSTADAAKAAAATAQGIAELAKSDAGAAAEAAGAAQRAASSAQSAADAAGTAAASAKTAAADADAKAAQAKADAVSKAAAAEQAAKVYAEAQAAAAKAAASDDATAKANAAKVAAAADAKAKADAAEAAAKAVANAAQATADAAKANAASAQQTADQAKTAAAAAQSAAGSAQNTANSALTMAGTKAKVFYSFQVPSGVGTAAGDLWRQVNSFSNIIAEWYWTGTVWQSSKITTSAISNLDVGKLTVGSAELDDVVARHIAARSGSYIELGVDQLAVTGSAAIKQAVIEKLYADVVKAKLLTVTDKIITKDIVAAGAIEAEALAVGALDFKIGRGMELYGALIEGGTLRLSDSTTAGLVKTLTWTTTTAWRPTPWFGGNTSFSIVAGETAGTKAVELSSPSADLSGLFDFSSVSAVSASFRLWVSAEAQLDVGSDYFSTSMLVPAGTWVTVNATSSTSRPAGSIYVFGSRKGAGPLTVRLASVKFYNAVPAGGVTIKRDTDGVGYIESTTVTDRTTVTGGKILVDLPGSPSAGAVTVSRSGISSTQRLALSGQTVDLSGDVAHSGGAIRSKRDLKILWQGAIYMNATQTINLSERISDQLTGIKLVWSMYENGAAADYSWQYTDVPKAFVSLHPGQGLVMDLMAWKTAVRKYLYIGDDKIAGNADNNLAPNNMLVLREVIGY